MALYNKFVARGIWTTVIDKAHNRVRMLSKQAAGSDYEWEIGERQLFTAKEPQPSVSIQDGLRMIGLHVWSKEHVTPEDFGLDEIEFATLLRFHETRIYVPPEEVDIPAAA